MIDFLDFPIDVDNVLRRRKKIKRQFSEKSTFKKIKVAVLGGSTTNELVNILELFLLKNNFNPSFYESDYNKFYEDAIFGNKELSNFGPDIIYVHTTHHNITEFPSLSDNQNDIEILLKNELSKFQNIWKALEKYSCPIIQNNFDYPINRSLGNLDCYDIHGKTYFLNKLNLQFAEEAQKNKSLFINDINYLSFKIGMDKWHNKQLWFTAKYAIGFSAIPILSQNIAKIIGAIYGATKKCVVLDLDNTCWGGIIGDDGLNGIKLGSETPLGEAFETFQKYIKELKSRGIILAVASKNDENNAKEGFEHSNSVLNLSDFNSFKANWKPKFENIDKISREINIGLDSIVFIDDNAMERSFVKTQLPSVQVPDIGDNILNYIDYLEGNGYFEIGSLSNDDINRSRYYSDNKKREQEQHAFRNYQDFLASLKMKAEIKQFSIVHLERITQLINKTNQFNLTTKRYTISEVRSITNDQSYISLYGKLKDKFGDNGLTSIIIGKLKDNLCTIDIWLMSCRVLKRDMELAMFEVLIKECKKRNLEKIIGKFKKTPKNGMVENLYADLGFTLINKKNSNYIEWQLNLNNYSHKEHCIEINNNYE